MTSSSYATHIVGGELNYKCIGGESYEITLTIRRDCLYGADDAPFDDPASISIYDTDGNLQVLLGAFGQIVLPFMGQDTLDSSIDDCGPMGNDVCVHEAIYRGVVNIPSSFMQNNNEGFILTHQRCCRNNTIVNIVDPLETGASYYIHMTPEALAECNSSPKFKEWHPIYTCLNQNLIFDHSATDAEGDSLVYRLCTPKNGASIDMPQPIPALAPPYENVNWANGFSEMNMMGTSVPLVIDSERGVLQCIPNQLGQFLIGVCVDEYRNGVLLSSTIRDFEINVVLCPTDVAAFFTYEQKNCEDQEITFQNFSQNADEYLWDFDFPNGNPAFSSDEENPVFTYTQPGDYLVLLEAINSQTGCSALFMDTIFVTDGMPELSYESIIESCSGDSITVKLRDTSFDNTQIPVTSRVWIIETDDFFLTEQEECISFTLPADSEVTITLQDVFDNACTSVLIDQITLSEVLPEPAFNINLLGCGTDESYSVRFTDNTDHLGLTPIGWEWIIDIDGSVNTYQGPSIDIIVYGDQITITQSISYDNGCEASTMSSQLVDDLLSIYEILAVIDSCLPDGSFLYSFFYQLKNNVIFNEPATSVSWTITNTLGDILATGMDSTIQYNYTSDSIFVYLSIETETCQFEINEAYSETDLTGKVDYSVDLIACENEGVELIFNDASMHLLGATIESISWEFNSSLGSQVLNGNSVQINVPDQGLLTLTQTVSYTNGCVISDSFLIDIEELLSGFINIVATKILCDNDDVTYLLEVENLSGASILNYNWTYNINGIPATSIDPSVNVDLKLGDQLDALVTVELDNGCDINSDSIQLIAESVSLEFYGSPIIPCMGDTVFVLDNHNPEWTYNWEPLTGLIFINGPNSNPQVVTDVDAIYNVTVTDGLCIAEGSVEVDLDGEISLEIQSTTDFCDEDGNLSYTFSPDLSISLTAVESYQWQSTINGLVGFGNDDDYSIDVVEGDSIEVILNVSFANDCPNVADTLSFFAALPSIEFLSDTISGCPMDTVSLVSNPNPNWEYDWSPLTDLIFTNGDLSNPQVQLGDDRTYYVTVTEGECMIFDSIFVTSDGTGELNITGDTLVCTNQINLTLNNIDPAWTIEWSTDQLFQNILPSTNGSLDYLVPFDFDILTLYIRVTAPGDECYDGLVQEVSIRYIGPKISYQDTVRVCETDTFIYTIQNLDPSQVLSFEWLPDTHILSGLNDDNVTVAYDQNQNDFTLYFTVENDLGCSRMDSILFMASVNEQLDFTHDVLDCESYTICFKTTNFISGSAIWDFGDISTVDDVAMDTLTPCYTYDGPGEYLVSLMDDGDNCQGIQVIKRVIVEEIPTISTNIDTLVFSGDTTFILTATSNYPSDSIKWCLEDGTGVGVGDTLVYTPIDTENIIAKVTNSYDCADSISIHIMRFEGFMDISLTSSLDTVCAGEEFTLEIMSPMDLTGFTFDWSPDECIVDESNPLMPVVTADESKTFVVNISEPNMDFDTTMTYTIIVYAPEVSVIVIDGPDVFLGMDKTLEVENPNPDYIYDWSNGQTDISIVVTPDSSGVYYVTATDEQGCIAVDSVSINVINPKCNEEDVWLPNAFTPNGDGNNDVFMVRSNFIKEMELLIYNRWGEEVFRSTDQSMGWDGTFMGEELMPDVFGYSLSVICTDDQEYTAVGNVSLIR